MKEMAAVNNRQEQNDKSADSLKVKVICLGDSAVGKSKLVERYLLGEYQPEQLSTYALTYFKHQTTINGEQVTVDFWDTAGQERFKKMHPSYYHQAHSCILVFDITRKITYKNLPSWYQELREYRPEIPVICAANKIDVDYEVTKKNFQFPIKHNMPFYFVSASDGTNVVKLFQEAIKVAIKYRNESTDYLDQVLDELEHFDVKERHSSGDQKADMRNNGSIVTTD